jgi:hypothetical protein
MFIRGSWPRSACWTPHYRGARSTRIADLGCLEGGYSVEFARLGYQTLGLDVREANIEVCRYVKSRVALPNLVSARQVAPTHRSPFGSMLDDRLDGRSAHHHLMRTPTTARVTHQ